MVRQNLFRPDIKDKAERFAQTGSCTSPKKDKQWTAQTHQTQ